jgi:hypothetical protein
MVNPPINPDTGKPVNIWCGGQSMLADGRILVTGGNYRYQQTGYSYRGLKRIYTFNPFNETWRRATADAARALVPHADPAAGRPGSDHERPRRERPAA